VFRRYEVDVVDVADILQFNEPLRKLFWLQGEAILLVSDGMVLTKDTAKVAPREKDGTRTPRPLDWRLLAEMRRNAVHDDISADETGACPLEAIHAAHSRAQVAVAQMRVGFGPLLGCLQRREEGVARARIVEEELWWDGKSASARMIAWPYACQRPRSERSTGEHHAWLEHQVHEQLLVLCRTRLRQAGACDHNGPRPGRVHERQ